MAEVYGVVGGGIVGLAVAREITQRRPGAEVVVIEKEDRLAAHQTGHNSGVVHAGIYYSPGSLKADLCGRGRALLREYVQENDLPYAECGKLVVALDESEADRLDALERHATTNRVPGLRRVAGADLLEVEPHATGLVALHSPATAITDYVAIAQAFAAEVMLAGGQVELQTTVTGIRRERGRIRVATDRGPRHVDRLVLCGGLQADRLSRLADGVDGPRIVPFRGEYLRVVPEKQHLVRGMVYPVPDPRFPFLGVHFTRRVTGELEVGPNAVLARDREAYLGGGGGLADLRSTLTWPGFWLLARQHWRTGARELRGSLSTAAFMRDASRYVAGVGPSDVTRGGPGVRAQAVERDGSLVDDFRIGHEDGITTVRTAPSPAATSCLAIAAYVVDRMFAAGAPA